VSSTSPRNTGRTPSTTTGTTALLNPDSIQKGDHDNPNDAQSRPIAAAEGGPDLRLAAHFFLDTFALSWGTGVLYVLLQEKVEAIFGPMGYTNPVFIFLVYAPGIIGVLMVWRNYGLSGLRGFFRRFTPWRMSLSWWLLLVLGTPAVFYAGAAINGNLTDPFPFSPW